MTAERGGLAGRERGMSQGRRGAQAEQVQGWHLRRGDSPVLSLGTWLAPPGHSLRRKTLGWPAQSERVTRDR